jgi:hypothetical protein
MYFRQQQFERKSIHIEKREDSHYKAKHHRQYLGEQLRDHRIEDNKRWKYYKEARELIVKGLKIRNRNINAIV